ncbi:MAG: glycosyltransferase family 39 protein [Planctomycetes bacterium]|nr:glycosyltransferase family 39 protein [Planctomycetota bacterium]
MKKTRHINKIKKNIPKPVKIPSDNKILNWKYWAIAILAFLCLCIVSMRLYTYNEPFERDITSHAVIAHEMLNGKPLYSDLWDSKPPAIFVTYAIAEILFGYGPLQVFFIGIISAIVTMIGIYHAGKKISSAAGGLWAAALWAFICSDLWLWANQPNIEVGINACLVWAFVLMLGADSTKLQPGRWISVGLLFACATLYKPVAIAFAILLAGAYVIINFSDKQKRKMAVLHFCIIGAAAAALWFSVFGYFAATGRFQIFYDTMVTYGQYYTKSRGGSLGQNVIEGLTIKRLFPRAVKSTTVLGVVAVIGIIAGLWKGCRKKWVLVAVMLISGHLAVSLPGRFYNHYYQLWLIGLTVAAGSALAIKTAKEKQIPLWVTNTTGSIALAILIIMVWPQYKLSPDMWSANKQGPQYIITKQIATELDKLLKDDETLYVWGINPSLYFWTKRPAPTGVIWATDMMDSPGAKAENPLAKAHTERALQDLKKAKPEIIAINLQHVQRPKEHPVVIWMMQNYVKMPGNAQIGLLNQRPFFYILIRKDGQLIKRLNTQKQS